jgi:uncharacterized surface protein with fasciclin (FAS1) repeats
MQDVFGSQCGAPGALDRMATQPAANAVIGNPQLSFSGKTLEASGLVAELDTHRALTVFVPTDQAVAALRNQLGDDAFTSVFRNEFVIGRLVHYFVLDQRYNAAGLVAAGTVRPEFGGTLRIRSSGGTMTVTDDNGGTATVTCGNIPTRNATIFIIDRMLIPANSPLLQGQAPKPWNCQPSPGAYQHGVICTKPTT